MGLSLCVRRDFTIDAISTNWLTKFNIRWYKWLRIKNGKCLNQSHVFCPSAVLLWLWHDGWCGNLYYDHFPCCDCLMNWSAIKAFEQLTGFITLSSCLVNVTVSIVLITNRSGRQFVLCFFSLAYCWNWTPGWHLKESSSSSWPSSVSSHPALYI